MLAEYQFEYPSVLFFEKLEQLASGTSLTPREVADQFFMSRQSNTCTESTSELLVRLKKQITQDYHEHANEVKDQPYDVVYILYSEAQEGVHILCANTALISKSANDRNGRVLYGVSIIRIGPGSFLSEDSY
jgi:hypothetical protein